MPKPPAKSAKHTEKKPQPAQTFFRKVLRRATDSSLPEIIFISTFILIRWWNNSDFSYLSEIFAPILLFSVLVSVIYYLFRWILKPGLGAHVAALSLSYLLYIFQFIEGTRGGKFIYDLLPDSLSTAAWRSLVLTMVLAALCGLAGWLVVKAELRYRFLKQLQLYKVLLFVIVFIFSIQLVRTASRQFEMKQQLDYEHPALSDVPAGKPDAVGKPDIYYLVFDRYANAEVLRSNFDFDNSELTDYLSDQGFVTRPGAYSNYPFTMSSISSTMAMQYFPELENKFGPDGKWQSAAPYRNILENPPVAKLLSSQGYKYNQVSSWWDFTRIGINADADPSKSFRLRVFNNSVYLSDLQRDIVFKSVLSPWLKKGVTAGSSTLIKYDLDRHPRENFETQLKSLQAIAGRADKSVPQFSFAHILAPHPPYVFDDEGEQPTYDGESNDNGADETVKYINELIYVNKRLKQLISQIKQKSPDAVIILQADEGPYPKQFRGALSAKHYYDPMQLALPQMKQKFGILASYHLPGIQASEVEQIGSSVNAFRLVLNKYLDYEFPMLPDCYFSMGNKFNIYNYTLVNDKLGVPDPASECSKFE